jgi:hypothetical protein
VYNGSLFEIGTQPPADIFKLIYHWSCQSNISKVSKWVKVGNATIDRFFTYCRAVCVAAVQGSTVLSFCHATSLGRFGTGAKLIISKLIISKLIISKLIISKLIISKLIILKLIRFKVDKVQY